MTELPDELTVRRTRVPGLAQLIRRITQNRTAVAQTLLGFTGVLLLWEWAIDFFEVPRYIAAPPSAVVTALLAGLTSYWPVHIAVTMFETLVGFLIGSALGIVIGASLVMSPLLKRLLYPYLVGFQALPKIAIAPLIVVWFGFGIESKVIIVVSVALFPVMINVMAGLESAETERLQLMKVLRASKWQTMRYVQFPSALPYLFAGLYLAVVFSLIGAIVGEFVGARQGLGVLLLQANFQLDIAGSFALFVLLATLGYSLYATVQFVHRRVVFWGERGVDVAP